MPPILKYIDVENFKSYRGQQRFGPMESFTAIVGSTGSGKSNLVDAVSFVMGAKASSLLATKLSTSVTATFVLEDMTEIKFQRAMIDGLLEHKIDGQKVSVTQYRADLKKLGINVEANNYLVHQDTITNIAMKNPKEITALFEDFSGSGVLKEKYDECRDAMNRAYEEKQSAYQKTKVVNGEREEVKFGKEEAEKLTQLKKELEKQKLELQLFLLYHNENDTRSMQKDLQYKQQELIALEKKQQKVQEALKEKKKEMGAAQSELAKIEQYKREPAEPR